MPSPAFRPDVLKLLGLKNWNSLRDEAMANLARKRRIWAENPEARAALLEQEVPPPISNIQRTINARGDDNNADTCLWDLKDLGLRALFADQDDEDQARSSDSDDDSDSFVDYADEELSVEDPDDSNDEDSDEEDSGGDGDEGSYGGDEDESSEDEGVEESDVNRARRSSTQG
ncbi:hypothetical protein Neosp_001244 [[Neocosmospora] mangrovei]